MTNTVRPTKKQRELLTFIQQFIQEHGYSPSYREVMTGLQYTSVATVALHINNLIKRGHLRKRDHSARSLEVVQPADGAPAVADAPPQDIPDSGWFVGQVEQLCQEAERAEQVTAEHIDRLLVLAGALQIIGLEDTAQTFAPRIQALKQKVDAGGLIR